MNSGIRKGEALEERTVVELGRLLDVTAVEGGQEVREIGAEDGRVEANRQRPSVDRVLAKVSADGVEGLMEGVLGPLRVALGPQIEEQLSRGTPESPPLARIDSRARERGRVAAPSVSSGPSSRASRPRSLVGIPQGPELGSLGGRPASPDQVA